jgi:HK97 family phage prohead protease
MSEIAEKRKAPPKTGVRHYAPARDLEVRQEGENGTATFGGYAILWEDPTEILDWLGSFTEVFVRGAFKKTIAERGPKGNGQIKFMRQHGLDSFVIAARYTDLSEDARGLRFEVETIDTTVGRDLAAEVRAGVIDTVSVGFDAVREEWDSDEEKRTVLEARLFEISAVNWPAYPNAKIDSVRAFERLPAYLDALLTELRAGKVLSAANMTKLNEARDLLNQVIASATPEDSPGPNEDSPDEEDAMDAEITLRGLEMYF